MLKGYQTYRALGNVFRLNFLWPPFHSGNLALLNIAEGLPLLEALSCPIGSATMASWAVASRVCRWVLTNTFRMCTLG